MLLWFMNEELETMWQPCRSVYVCMYVCMYVYMYTWTSFARSNWIQTTPVGNFNSLLPDLEKNPGLPESKAQL